MDRSTPWGRFGRSSLRPPHVSALAATIAASALMLVTPLAAKAAPSLVAPVGGITIRGASPAFSWMDEPGWASVWLHVSASATLDDRGHLGHEVELETLFAGSDAYETDEEYGPGVLYWQLEAENADFERQLSAVGSFRVPFHLRYESVGDTNPITITKQEGSTDFVAHFTSNKNERITSTITVKQGRRILWRDAMADYPSSPGAICYQMATFTRPANVRRGTRLTAVFTIKSLRSTRTTARALKAT